MQSSQTVHEAFELGRKYSKLIADVLAVTIGETGEDIYIEYAVEPEWAKEPIVVIRDCLNLTMKI